MPQAWSRMNQSHPQSITFKYKSHDVQCSVFFMVGIFHQYLITINKQDGGCNRVKPTLQLILMGSGYGWVDILDIFQSYPKICKEVW